MRYRAPRVSHFIRVFWRRAGPAEPATDGTASPAPFGFLVRAMEFRTRATPLDRQRPRNELSRRDIKLIEGTPRMTITNL